MSELPGGILAIDAHSGPAASEADVAELQKIVHSMVIEELPRTRIARGGPPIPLPTSGPLEPGNYSMANPYTDVDDTVRNCVFGLSRL